jgi:2-dehydropantoate 2-reductase
MTAGDAKSAEFKASPGIRPRILVVGAGAIGGVVAGTLLSAGHDVSVYTTNRGIADAVRQHGFRLKGETAARHSRPLKAGDVHDEMPHGAFDYVLLAVQPPQVEDAARSAASSLSHVGRVVCFQNGLCEERIARTIPREAVIGAVVSWGASMVEPGVYDRTSQGGFTLGRLDGAPDAPLRALAELLKCIGVVRITDNLIGARWSKLAINCAISTLGTIGGDRVGPLLRKRFVRRLALDIMSEATAVAAVHEVRLERVAGALDLDWLALTEAERQKPRLGLAAKHAVLLATGLRYRRLRSSMLAAIERGRPPAVDFLNGEIVERGELSGVDTRVNRAARDTVWQIARGELSPSVGTLRALYENTR